MLHDRRPVEGQSLGIAASARVIKRAALLFDRVYLGTDSDPDAHLGIPLEITFGFREGDSHGANVFEVLRAAVQSQGPELSPSDLVLRVERAAARAYVEAYQAQGLAVTPVLRSVDDLAGVFGLGAHLYWQVCVTKIPVVVEEATAWEQVTEFRSDQESLGHYRELRLFLNQLDAPESKQEAVDLIDSRLARYSQALSKHGFTTVVGSLSSIVGIEVGEQVAEVLALDPGVAFSLGVAGAALVLARHELEAKKIRADNREIAVLHEAMVRFGGHA